MFGTLQSGDPAVVPSANVIVHVPLLPIVKLSMYISKLKSVVSDVVNEGILRCNSLSTPWTPGIIVTVSNAEWVADEYDIVDVTELGAVMSYLAAPSAEIGYPSNLLFSVIVNVIALLADIELGINPYTSNLIYDKVFRYADYRVKVYEFGDPITDVVVTEVIPPDFNSILWVLNLVGSINKITYPPKGMLWPVHKYVTSNLTYE